MGIKKRGAVEWDVLIPWIIGIIVMVLVFVLYFVLKSKGSGALDYLKNLFSFGGG